MLKQGGIFTVLLLIPPILKAAPPVDFTRRWIATPMAIKQTPNGEVRVKLLERMARVGNSVFQIGNITYLKIPKPKKSKDQKFNPNDVAEKMRQALGLSAWHYRRQGAAEVFEAEWKKDLKWIRIYMTQDESSLSYSIALMRTAYLSSTLLESEVIQRGLAGEMDKKPPWLDRLFADISPATAHAAPCPSCARGDTDCLLLAYQCTSAELVKQVAITNSILDDMDKSVFPNFNTQLGNINQTLSIQLGATNKNLRNMTEEFKNMNTNWADTNHEFRRMNDLMIEITRPERVLYLSAASAFGAITGAAAANLMVEGLKQGAELLLEAITHAKEDAQILTRFRTAREAWEKESSLAANLEKAIDSILGLKVLEKLNQVRREDLITQLGTDQERVDARLRRARQLLDFEVSHQNREAYCKRYSQESAGFSRLSKHLGELLAVAEQPQSSDALCDQLRRNLGTLRELEEDLQRARGAILRGQEVFFKQYDEAYQKTQEDFRKAGDPVAAKRIYTHAQHKAREIWKTTLASLEETRNRKVEICLKQKDPTISLLDDLRRLFIYKKQCEEEVEKEFSAYAKEQQAHAQKAYKQMIHDAEQAYHKATGQSVYGLRSDDLTFTAGRKEMEEWFDQIAREQNCITRPEHCQDGQATLLSRFSALAKKGEKIEEVCRE